MVQLIPGCPGSTAEFWGRKYWKYIKGKSIELGENSSHFKISRVAPSYFYDYCYVYEWIDKYVTYCMSEYFKIQVRNDNHFSVTILASSSSMK